MRVKQLAIIALVGFIGMTSASKMVGSVKQRLAEVTQTPPPPAGGAPAGAPAAASVTKAGVTDILAGAGLKVADYTVGEVVVGTPQLSALNVGGFDECGCLHSATATSSDTVLASNNALSIEEDPDRSVKICEEECSSSCESTCESDWEHGCKYRHFCINGDITVNEEVCAYESGNEGEYSSGHAKKNTQSTENLCAGTICNNCYEVKTEAPLQYENCNCESATAPAPAAVSIAKEVVAAVPKK